MKLTGKCLFLEQSLEVLSMLTNCVCLCRLYTKFWLHIETFWKQLIGKKSHIRTLKRVKLHTDPSLLIHILTSYPRFCLMHVNTLSLDIGHCCQCQHSIPHHFLYRAKMLILCFQSHNLNQITFSYYASGYRWRQEMFQMAIEFFPTDWKV